MLHIYTCCHVNVNAPILFSVAGLPGSTFPKNIVLAVIEVINKQTATDNLWHRVKLLIGKRVHIESHK